MELARAHGASRIARALSLSSQALKDRVEERPPAAEGAVAAGGFVELQSGGFPASAPSVLELSDPSGRKLVIRLSSAVDLPTLVAAFWR